MEKQYLQLLRDIKEKGTKKAPAREGMPSTISLFGYQMRHNLADGFPLLTTKEINFKNIVVELLWFLRGDTNIKYLIDNGCNIWNEDAYNYYKKIYEQAVRNREQHDDELLTFGGFIDCVKNPINHSLNMLKPKNYEWGDCGYQYGKVWRKWKNFDINKSYYGGQFEGNKIKVDQIKNLIDGLKNNPESRRHIITSIDPAHENDLALYWCHVLAQFNCRPISHKERCKILNNTNAPDYAKDGELVDEAGIPRYYLDCSFYQRSADVFLGVPYNIASYALLTELLAKMFNMIPGDLIHSFGDVHIYENHLEAIDEQLSREPKELPTFAFSSDFIRLLGKFNGEERFGGAVNFGIYNDVNKLLNSLNPTHFQILGYKPEKPIRAKLSTGLK